MFLLALVAGLYAASLKDWPLSGKPTLKLGKSWKDCSKQLASQMMVRYKHLLLFFTGQSSDPIKIVNLTVSPDPPHRGNEVAKGVINNSKLLFLAILIRPVKSGPAHLNFVSDYQSCKIRFHIRQLQ